MGIGGHANLDDDWGYKFISISLIYSEHWKSIILLSYYFSAYEKLIYWY